MFIKGFVLEYTSRFQPESETKKKLAKSEKKWKKNYYTGTYISLPLHHELAIL